MRLILASASPRRRALLEAAGIPCDVAPPAVEENADPALPARALALHNARLKAFDVAGQYPGAVVLGADTLVSLDGEALGKPADAAEARAMLRRLSGRTHEVHTGVCLVRLDPRRVVEFAEVTHVRFRPLSDAAIEDYLRKVPALDKAGAYAAQEHGSLIIERLEGSFSNVVGLPIRRTRAALQRHFGGAE